MKHRIREISRIMGFLLIGFSITYLVPFFVSLIYKEYEGIYFLSTFIITSFSGIILWLPNRKTHYHLHNRDGFIIVTLFWTVLAFFGAIPLYLQNDHPITFMQAVFEATSGFTTTGATIFHQISSLPKCILWYRTQLNFLGGMGIIVLAVAIIPLLGMGGMTLFKAETPGPMKDEQIAPRITHTARNLWFVYLTLYGLCTIFYYWGGMNLFDALTHGFSTVSTAGFSNYDESIGYFKSDFIEWVSIAFMLLGGISFVLHFLVFKNKKPKLYFQNIELLVFFNIVLIFSVLVAILLFSYQVYDHFYDALKSAIFHVVSMITTTGFTTTDFAKWPIFLPLFMVLLGFLGACAGSTSGGIKVIRVILLVKQVRREIVNLIHPRAVLPVKLGNKIIPESILGGIWAFLGLYAFSTLFLSIIMIALGLTPSEAFSSVSACLNVLGLGSVDLNYYLMSNSELAILVFTMILGRLEIFTLFILLTPSFWRS